MAAPALGPTPGLTGTNAICPSSRGSLFTVTRPMTAPRVELPQPTAAKSRPEARSNTVKPRRAMGRSLEVGDHLGAARRTERLPGRQVNAVGDEADAAVAQEHLHAARVHAPRRDDVAAVVVSRVRGDA